MPKLPILGQVRFEIKDVVSTLCFAASHQFAAHDDAPKGDFLADLHHPVPASAFDRRTDELRADITFAQVLPVQELPHRGNRIRGRRFDVVDLRGRYYAQP